jgi:SAM-dependent methyltransferase
VARHINSSRARWDSDYYKRLSSLYLKNTLKLFDEKHASAVKILDAGCGFGETLHCFNETGFAVEGIDISEDCINISKQFAPASRLSIEQLSKTYPQGYFNVTVCSHTLEHVENPTIALQNLSHVTSDYLIIAVPNLARLINFVLRRPRHVNEGHRHGWDHHHLLTFIENNSDLVLHDWVQDLVTFPLIRNKLLYSKFASEIIEAKILSSLFPLQCNSVIAIFKKNASRSLLAPNNKGHNL